MTGREAGVIIFLDQIPEDGKRVRGEDAPAVLAVDSGVPVGVESPLRYDLFAQVVSGRLLVSGRLEAGIAMACSRCGCPVRLTVSEPAYRFDADVASLGESVDLTADMREAIVVLFPSYPVCDPGCKGLCPQCGANLNEGTCACEPPAEGDRWSLLDGWNEKRG